MNGDDRFRRGYKDFEFAGRGFGSLVKKALKIIFGEDNYSYALAA